MTELVLIQHTRKGAFAGKIISDDGEWIKVEITEGSAKYLSSWNNDAVPGDVITIRKSFCKITSVEE